jgi:hypothetical protein
MTKTDTRIWSRDSPSASPFHILSYSYVLPSGHDIPQTGIDEGKGHPVICLYRHSGVSVRRGVGSLHHAPAALPPQKRTVPLYRRRLAGHLGQPGQEWKISSSPGFDPRTVTSRYHNYAIPAATSTYTRTDLYGGLRPTYGQYTLNLQSAKWQWNKFYSKHLVCPMPTTTPPMLTYHHI